MALMPTPRTLATGSRASLNGRIRNGLGKASCLFQFLLDPLIGNPQTVAQLPLRLPSEHVPQARVVAIATAYALRPSEVVAFDQLLARNFTDHIRHLIDGHQFFGPKIQRFAIAAGHQPQQSINAVRNKHEGPGLQAVAPDVNVPVVGSQCHLAANGRRRFFFAAFVGAKRAINVVKANHPRLEAEVMQVVAAELLGKQLLPSVACFGICRISILLFQRRHIRPVLPVPRINASRGGEQESLDAVEAACLQHVSVNQDIVAGDLGKLRGNVADTSHVGCEVVNLVHLARGLQRVVPETKIEKLEFVGCGGFEFWFFYVNAADPIVLRLQPLYQMMTNEATGSGDQDTSYWFHVETPLCSKSGNEVSVVRFAARMEMVAKLMP